MLFKSTMKLLLVETDDKQLLVPIVANSYKKTLWLLHHREPSAVAVGVIEGPADELSFLQIGLVDVPTIHSQILRATNILYIAIGRNIELPGVFTLDYSLPLEEFILTYKTLYTPDEFLVILGIGHNKLFKCIGDLVATGKLEYIPENGPNKWSYYDYYWLNEKYKVARRDNIDLDIRPYVNRPGAQIRFRAHAVGFSRKEYANKKQVHKNDVVIIDMPEYSVQDEITLTSVERDYMLSQIEDIVTSCIDH